MIMIGRKRRIAKCGERFCISLLRVLGLELYVARGAAEWQGRGNKPEFDLV